MKKSLALLSLIGFLILGSCNQKPDVAKILENQESRTEIYKAISDNHDYLMEFMDSIHNNQNAMKLMRQNNMKMCKMMKDSTMMSADSTMNCKMHQKRKINHDCMQSCIKMMNDSTMMKCKMGDNKMLRQRKMIKDSTKMI